jgi:hypothetical protein
MMKDEPSPISILIVFVAAILVPVLAYGFALRGSTRDDVWAPWATKNEAIWFDEM